VLIENRNSALVLLFRPGVSVDDIRYYLWSGSASEILAAIAEGKREVTVSVDLNKSVQVLTIESDFVVFDSGNSLTRDELLSICKKGSRVFVLEGNALRILEYRGRSYYKLVPTEGAPTVEIDGVKMHRSKGIDPFEDAKLKVCQVVREGHRVLDTCGGLGYTAIWSARLGAMEVLSVERNEYIRNLRSENPWSEDLSNARIKLISGDVVEYIGALKTESIDSVIHDPPRFSLAGDLYGEAFYRQLYRVLVKGGGLFHYTGNPYLARRGNTFAANTARRLQSAGFKKVVAKPQLLGIKAVR